MREIFVDTGAWIAIVDERDKFHSMARSVYPQHLKNYGRLVTTNLVIAETYSITLNRLGFQATMQLMDGIRDSSRILQVYTTPQIDLLAFAILHKYRDQHFSFVDAISFAVMQEREISDAFAYDRHFSVVGFHLRNQ